MKTKIFALMLASILMLFSLSSCLNSIDSPESVTKYGLFDTFTTIQSYGIDSDDVFENKSELVFDILDYYNRQFDIYNEYEGINNLCTVNKNAGIAPVTVDQELIDFLEYAIEICNKCNGEINIAMGSVLSLWHDAREKASSGSNIELPMADELEQASRHTDLNSIIINKSNSTVYISDPQTSIDVGAIGKGYAVMKATEYLREYTNTNGYVINAGGNISLLGTKSDGSGWVTGITNPDKTDENQFATRIEISDTCCVTSGNYERFFEFNGEIYHHIIDKDTLYPARYFSSVTVICHDSAVADALSTALFCMSIDEGRALLAQFDNVEVIWITLDGVIEKTAGINDIALS